MRDAMPSPRRKETKEKRKMPAADAITHQDIKDLVEFFVFRRLRLDLAWVPDLLQVDPCAGIN
jgi:hypothetical protein